MDNVSKETRSKIMGSIKAQSKLETLLSKALWNKGFRFRRNVRSLFGTPDIAIKKYKLVIFVDSCYWHQCPIHGNIPKSNVDFWEEKFRKNRLRDQKVNEYYTDKGWTILRYWEHEIRKDFSRVLEEIIITINSLRKENTQN